jgi:hypothetical protein
MVKIHFDSGHYWGKKAHTNNNKPTTSRCLLVYHSKFGDHFKLKTIRLWLPVSMMSFLHFFVPTQRQFLLFMHSYCHHFGGSFMVKLNFYSGHYWGKNAHTNNNKPTT